MPSSHTPQHRPIRTEYVNIWTAPGLLGAPPRYHSSVVYESAGAALIGREVPPGGGFSLAGTLDLRPGHGQPRFVALQALQQRDESEQEDSDVQAAELHGS